MSSPTAAFHRRAPVVVLALLAAGGIALGWFLNPAHAHSLTQASGLFEPLITGTLCCELIRRRVKHWRWLVPSLLGAAILTTALRSAAALPTVLGLVAGSLTMLCCLCRYPRAAIATTLLCSGSLLVAAILELSRAHHG